MIHETMTVKQVAEEKGVSEAAVRFVVNDPKSRNLEAVRSGRQLLILASSVASYKPREYPRMNELLQIANSNQRRIHACMLKLAADLVAKHALAARLIQHSFPCGFYTHNGRPAYSPGVVLEVADDLRVEDRTGEAPQCFIDYADDEPTIRRKVEEWALLVVADGWVKDA